MAGAEVIYNIILFCETQWNGICQDEIEVEIETEVEID